MANRAMRYPRTSDPIPRLAAMLRNVCNRRAVVVFVDGCLNPFNRCDATAKEKFVSKLIPVIPSSLTREAWTGSLAAIMVLARPFSLKASLASKTVKMVSMSEMPAVNTRGSQIWMIVIPIQNKLRLYLDVDGR